MRIDKLIIDTIQGDSRFLSKIKNCLKEKIEKKKKKKRSIFRLFQEKMHFSTLKNHL
jgi:hypothetical protein